MKNIFYTLLIITGVFLSGSIHAMKRNTSHLNTNIENQPQEAPWLPGEVIDHIAGYCEPTEKDLLMKACKHFNARLKNKESIMLANPSTVTLSHKIKKMFECTNSGDAIKLSIWLSTLNAEDVNEYNNEGLTPLHIASQNGSDKIAALLIKVGADANKTDKKENKDEEYIYSKYEDIETFRYTPLHYASANGHTNIIRLLLTLDRINVNDWSNYLRHAPLHPASANGHIEAVRLLLTADEIIIDDLEEDVGTPLHIAAENGHTEVVRLLLNAGADVNYTSNNHGYSPLHAALQSDNPHIEIIKLLIDYGADIDEELWIDWDSDHNWIKKTPLEIAQEKDLTEIAKLISETHEKNIVNSFLNF